VSVIFVSAHHDTRHCQRCSYDSAQQLVWKGPETCKSIVDSILNGGNYMMRDFTIRFIPLYVVVGRQSRRLREREEQDRVSCVRRTNI
jgi:hypothetical protein